MIQPAARLVMPAIRWDDTHGFEPARPGIEAALALGVGGFILFGGERHAVQRLTRDLRAAASYPLLIASDLERGAGQQFRGLTSLPPLGALATLGTGAVREAAALTARQARDVGVDLVLAPVCDLDIEPANPIVQARSFGADGFEVAAHASDWIVAAQAEGVLACAKHFPGHGRTTVDSHAELPVVPAGRELGRDLMPFRRAVAAEVATVMTSHVSYPAWDASGAPATWSRAIIGGLLRKDLFFGGLVVTDALIMEGARDGGGEAAAAARIVAAGGDLLLYPHDPAEAVRGLSGVDLEGSLLRLEQAVRRVPPPVIVGDAELAGQRTRGEVLCRRAVRVLRGDLPRLSGRPVAVDVIDDDAGGPYPLPPRTAFAAALRDAGMQVRADGEPIVLVFADVKGWKGRAGLSAANQATLAALLARPAATILFGHPRRLVDVPGNGPVLCAWSGDTAMQRAVAERLVSGA